MSHILAVYLIGGDTILSMSHILAVYLIGGDTILSMSHILAVYLIGGVQGGPEKTKPKLFKVIYPQT